MYALAAAIAERSNAFCSKFRVFAVPLLLCLFCSKEVFADPLTHLSIDELINIDVTSLQRKEEPVFGTASALFVITQQDIRRSNATSIPELLRMVPGVHVAQIEGGSAWAVGVRGLNGRFSNKLLVMIDGRSIYNPLFSGVDWEQYDVVLEDIERIEVIRGPGSTMWGSNAVNGVINIITKSAEETLGTYASARSGSLDLLAASLRHGMKIGEFSDLRVWGKFHVRDDSRLLEARNGSKNADDAAVTARGGFRLDMEPRDSDSLTFSGDVFTKHHDEVRDVPSSIEALYEPVHSDVQHVGSFLLGSWDHRFSAHSETHVQSFVEYFERKTPAFNFDRYTFDIDLQHRYALSERQEFVWGLNYRNQTLSSSEGTIYLEFEPEERGIELFSFFLQNEYALIENELHFTLGSKFEQIETSGFSVLPTVRMAWKPNLEFTLWGAVSGSARTPSIAEEDARFLDNVRSAGNIPAIVFANANRNVDEEYLIAYETGFRYQITENLLYDATAFYNHYTDVINAEFAESRSVDEVVPRQEIDVSLKNKLDIDAYGFEQLIEWRPTERWRLLASLSFIELNTIGEEVFRDAEREAPNYIAHVSSQYNYSDTIYFDLTFRAVDDVKVGSAEAKSPHYEELDARIAWLPNKNLEIALAGTNLIEDRHTEWTEPYFARAAQVVERSFYLQAIYRY